MLPEAGAAVTVLAPGAPVMMAIRTARTADTVTRVVHRLERIKASTFSPYVMVCGKVTSTIENVSGEGRTCGKCWRRRER